MYNPLIQFIREHYNIAEGPIPLHAPVFNGNEKKYLIDCIDSSFVSSVGKYVTEFEQKVAEFTGSKYAVAAVNGTAALHIALKLAGVEQGSLVITQPLTFVATANAIHYCGAEPVFVDVDKETLGMSPDSLRDYLLNYTYKVNGITHCKNTHKPIRACLPMHTFGHCTRIGRIKEICDQHNIVLVEDAAESLGSYFDGIHTGNFGLLGILSFNGNKTITTGGGGMIITNSKELALKAKHITTTAKAPHQWEYYHDELGYNYRLTNLAAALGVAQMEQLPGFLASKHETAMSYEKVCDSIGLKFVKEPNGTHSNYWLNAVILNSKEERDAFLTETNAQGIMTRPIWKLMNSLPAFKNCFALSLSNAEWLEERVVNLPSSVRLPKS